MIYIIISAVIITADQLFKQWISAHVPVGGELRLLPGLIRLTNVHNTGAAFSLFQDMQTIILIITGVFCLIVIFGLIMKSVKGVFGNLALAMVLGGALGNMIDRVLTGSVVDMFDFQFIRFAVFNIADVFITFGALMFCVFILRSGKIDNILTVKSGKKRARVTVSEPEIYDYTLDSIIVEFSDPTITEQSAGKGMEDDPDNSGS
ncbi:MAG: signal peptidase II [Clostridiales bacterium]|jgi:signal peptidase II|nr:signal peptidase II [Clostridiales bacterium]